MCSLRKDDFCSRAPVFVGDILWEHLQLLQAECDREQAALKNAPPKLSEIAQNPAAISPTPPAPRSFHLAAHSPPPPLRPYSAHQPPPSPSPHHHHHTGYPTTASHSHSPPIVYSDCSSSSPQRPPPSPPRVYTMLESSGAAPRLFSPAGYRPTASPQQYHSSQSPGPVSPPLQQQQQQQQQDIKSEYPAYPGYPGALYHQNQYPRNAYPPPLHLQSHHAQFTPAAYGGHPGYPAAYSAAFQPESQLVSPHYQLTGRWGHSDPQHPGAYQVNPATLLDYRRRIDAEDRQRSSLLFEGNRIHSIPCRAGYFALQ